MPDLQITLIPQDPGISAEPEDLVVAVAADGLSVVPIANDLVTAPIAQDLAVTVPLQDLAIEATPIGPPGPAGPAGATPVYIAVAFQALGGQRVVKPLPAGAVDYASSDVPSDGDQVLGITQGAANEGEQIMVQTGGIMTESSWNLIVGAPVYCGVNGLLTQTPPTSGMLCRVGKATKPTQILINVEEAIILA